MEYTGIVCDVYPYSDSYKSLKQVPLKEVVTAYDHPTGETFILVLAQALYLGDQQKPSLLCPNQMRSYGMVADDVPKHPSVNCALMHSIYIPSMDLQISLELDGVISYINTWYPNELEVENCTHISLTSSTVWKPQLETMAEQEAIIANSSGVIHPGKSNWTIFALNRKCEVMTTLSRISPALVDDDFLQGLESCVHVSAIQTKSRHSEIKARELALCWGTGIEAVERTLKATTQLGVQSAIHPSHCRYRTKQLQYRYNWLNMKLYADVFFLSVPSLSGNTCGVIFVNYLGFLHIVPMKSKSQAGNALTEFFEDKGVPTVMHTDGAKEFTQGHWVARRFYLNMEVSSKYLLNLTVLGRIKQKLEFANTRNKSLEC